MAGLDREYGLHLSRDNFWILVAAATLIPITAGSDGPSATDRWAVTLTAGTTETLDIDKASAPRLLTIHEGNTDLEILVTSPDEAPLSIDNGVGRRSQEWLHLAAGRDYRIELFHRDGPAGDSVINLAIKPLTEKQSAYWQPLAAAFYKGALDEAALATISAAMDSEELAGGARTQLRYSLALRLAAVGRLDEAATLLQALALAVDASWNARANIDLANVNFRRGNLAAAEGQLLRAAQLAVEAGDIWSELIARGNRCRLLQTKGKARQARSCTRAALTRAIAAEERRLAATLRYNLGGLEVTLANPAAAREAFDDALRFFDYSQDLEWQGRVAGALALLERRLGHQERALAFQARALDAARKTGERSGIALATVNLANLYLLSGDLGRARPLVEESALLSQELNDLTQWRRALAALSSLEYQALNYERAEIYRRQALALAGELKNQAAILSDRVLLAEILTKRGQLNAALAEVATVESRLHAAPNLEGQMLNVKGQALAASGQATAARTALVKARRTNQRADQRVVELSSLIALAELELQQDQATRAEVWIKEARRLIDEMRLTINDPGLRLQFSRAFSEVASLELETTIAIGGDDVAERSFAVAERNRARTLVDLLARTDAAPPVPEPALQEQLIDQRERLALTRVRLEVAVEPRQIASITRAVQQLRQAVELTEAQVAESYPNFPALAAADVDIALLQAQLDPDTWLVEFSLGEERSLAWLVSSDSVELFELPPKRQLEMLARDIHSSMNPPRPMESLQPSLDQLADLLLSPLGVAGRPPKRLLLVADAALHYVPFAALVWPGTELPLIETTELVQLPSAQAVLLQRRTDSHSIADKTLLIMADPVFDGSDTRLARPQSAPGENLSRLVESGNEARSIAALVEPSEVDLLDAFHANRAGLLNTDLSRYRMLHLATHASSHSSFPELSGLTLSTMNPEGVPINGFVGLRDLFRLRQSPQLVVLSACDTALGNEVRGEGLVGLTRGFLYAGARQVVGTLWPIEDRANTQLMLEFYRQILNGSGSAASALQAAQRVIRRQPSTSHPFYWSGVALYGDWR